MASPSQKPRRLAVDKRKPATRYSPSAPSIQPRHYSSWRAATLILVYLLMAAHIAHWRISGKTLAPLELNEVMYTMELGIVTAGFLFMVIAALSAAIFGRFFCSWACHILALEDLCAWLLKKIRIHPKPVRSRVLLFVPPAAMFYMFLWPQISRIVAGRPRPEMKTLTDQQGWASFLTTDYWRNLPGPWIIFITFAICGFAIVYFLGSRGFCTYACPYGVVFGLVDRLAPGRIKLKGVCQQCGTCTATCQSHVSVHEELAIYGKVVDPACMKDLDCVSVCPQGALGYGFTRPALLQSFKARRRRIPYDFSLGQDVIMAAVMIITLLIFRGLYGTVPFLMTLALGAILAYTTVLCLRLAAGKNVRLNNFQLKQGGRLTGYGKSFIAIAAIFSLFVIHSGWIRYHEFFGHRGFEQFTQFVADRGSAASSVVADNALKHLQICRRWGLFTHPLLEQRLASLQLAGNSPGDAEPYLHSRLANAPDDCATRLTLGRLLIRLGRREEAIKEFRRVVADTTAGKPITHQQIRLRAAAHLSLGKELISSGDKNKALNEYYAALTDQPNNAAIHLAMGDLLADLGRLTEAVDHYEVVLNEQADSALAHYNLGVVLSALGREDEAIGHYRSAVEIKPHDPDSHNNLGFLLAKRGQTDEAATQFQLAIDADPNYSHAHFNLARILLGRGQMRDAESHFIQAARLDPQYAKLLGSQGKTAEHRPTQIDPPSKP